MLLGLFKNVDRCVSDPLKVVLYRGSNIGGETWNLMYSRLKYRQNTYIDTLFWLQLDTKYSNFENAHHLDTSVNVTHKFWRCLDDYFVSTTVQLTPRRLVEVVYMCILKGEVFTCQYLRPNSDIIVPLIYMYTW